MQVHVYNNYNPKFMFYDCQRNIIEKKQSNLSMRLSCFIAINAQIPPLNIKLISVFSRIHPLK